MTYVDKPSVPSIARIDNPVVKKGTKMDIMLNTGSDIYQGACKKRGSTLKDEYRHASGTAYMDPNDMAKLGVKNWDTAIVTTDYGQVTVYVAHSRDAPHEGQIFICKGPWANVVVSPETYCCCDPTYKGVPATIEVTDDDPLLMADLMAEVYKKYNEDETSTANKLLKLPDNNPSHYRK